MLNLIGTGNEERRKQWIQKNLLTIPPGKKILDAGAGECQYRQFCQHLKYTSQDIANYTGSGDRKGLQTGRWDNSQIDIVSDITQIPRPDKSFDAVLCTEVLEHVENPFTALNEFSRLTKKGGWLILTAPFASLVHFSPHYYYSGFSTNFYKKNLPKYGYKLVKLELNGSYFEHVGQEARRLKEVTKNFTNARLYPWDIALVWLYLQLLHRLSKNDRNSTDLLYLGCHVLARKVK